MGCYWEINGEIVAKEESTEQVMDVLDNYGMQIDEEKDEKISFSYYDDGSYGKSDDLDHDLRPLVKSGEFTARTDEENSTYCYRYGKEPGYEESVVLEYFPSEVDEFVKTLPKELIDAVVKEYSHNDGDAIDKFTVNPEHTHCHHYDCNHDCDALYEAYQKGKNDERVRIMKAIEGGE